MLPSREIFYQKLQASPRPLAGRWESRVAKDLRAVL
jgi:hypothetical protein